MNQIGQDTVVSITYELFDSDGRLIEKSEETVSYLHGGYDGIFPAVEAVLEGKGVGESFKLSLQPEDAFGEYDSELVRIEPKTLFPDNVAVGMQFEGGVEGSDDVVLYTVTDIADGKVVVDGNHPLAGQTLHFSCTVTGIREATEEEVGHGHVHGPHGHHH
ncbi:MAG: peptidylprolyl isomerase [Pseudomonadota bacterium]